MSDELCEVDSKPPGRPTTYSPEVGNLICEQIMLGYSLNQICKKYDLARGVVYQWKNRQPEFADNYARARIAAAEGFLDELNDVSRDVADDMTAIQKARLRCDQLKFLAMKLAPRIYGDLVKAEAGLESSTTNIGVQVNIQINTTDSKDKLAIEANPLKTLDKSNDR